MPEKRSSSTWAKATPKAKAKSSPKAKAMPTDRDARAMIQFQIGGDTITLAAVLREDAMQAAERCGEECAALDEVLQRLRQLTRTTVSRIRGSSADVQLTLPTTVEAPAASDASTDLLPAAAGASASSDDSQDAPSSDG